MKEVGLFTLCYIIVFIGYKLWGFEITIIGLSLIIAFNSFSIDKEGK